MNRDEQLMDPRWQRKKAEMCSLVGWKCETCGREDQTLHVHHKFYEIGRTLWEYDATELKVLCRDCHTQTEQAITEIRNIIGCFEYYEINALAEEWFKSVDGQDPRALLNWVKYHIARFGSTL